MNSRPPPPQGAPPPYAFVTRVYRKSLRPIVLFVSATEFLWTLFACIGHFRNSALDRLGSVASIKTVYIVLGALYMLCAAIGLFGVVAAYTQRMRLIRVYAYATALDVLLIAGTGLLQIVIHFTLKNDIINACTNLSKDGSIVVFGFWGPRFHDLTNEEASVLCRRDWDRESWQSIVVFLVTTLLVIMFSAIAFAYLRQMLDPTSAANSFRAPNAGRVGDYPSHYNPPYNTYNAPPSYGQPAYGGYGNDVSAPPYEGKPGFMPSDNKNDDPFGDPREHGSGSRV
ncbi:hypothetical protein Agabi119p4_8677 [Agaricus bisporus var. burnettii]|uniref:Uncharacterized protein n=1 Tax=Agaricus bisporus var. burnettii TaxID=192524 RepID=A0A8H7EXE9_AGABI|nr:hypothetical protein Agabi119p4_8677 [Agaricus bisporus var. burnettii]